MASVVLFDIDGTLVDCGGAGRRAMDAACEAVLGVKEACRTIAFGGMTDRAIARAAIVLSAPARVAEGEAAVERLIDDVLESYLEILRRDLPASPSFRVLPGAHEMAEVARKAGHAVGLGTGNLREGARLKLERARLWDLFDFGGFGCDAEARPALLDRGRARGAERLGEPPETCVTLVVGDTPLDVRAAHAIGARCLAVASGRFDRASLEAAGADEVVDTLLDPSAARVIQNPSRDGARA